MNTQNFRVIFNKSRGMLMAVAENVSSQGKASGAGSAVATTATTPLLRFAQMAVTVAMLFNCVSIVSAQIVADPNAGSRRPTITTAPNGVPLVQITKPNSSGLSHNQFSQLAIDSKGVVLGNSPTVVNSQLAGYVPGNPNLTNGSASVILNEVTSTNRAVIGGTIEVAGQRAVVVIADPNGITVGGGGTTAGYINTSRAILTTGAPVFAADGSLSTFHVTGGDIQIGSAGLNAASADTLDLISRSIAVNGPVWANQLNAVVGTNEVNYSGLGVKVLQGDNNKPALGVDIASLGGMYSGKIFLVSTESGVGVRNLGNIASSAGDLNLDSQGKITLAGPVSATGQVTIHSHDGIVNSGTVYSGQTAQLSSDNQIANTGTVAAQGDLTLYAGSIASTGVLGAGIDANGKATQNGNLSLIAAGNLSATGQNTAGTNIGINGASVDLSHAQTSAGGTVAVTARSGDINHTGGNLQSTGAATLSASGAVINDQGVIGAAQLTSSSATLSNHGGTLNQSGTGETSIATSGLLDNSSGVITTAGQNVNLQAGSFTNDAGQLSHTGSGTLTVNAGAVSNVAGNVATGGQLALTASSLNNQRGQMIAAGTEHITASGAVSNNQGVLQAGSALNLQAGAIDNSAGRITSLDTSGLTLTTNGQLTNAAGTTAGGAAGGVIGGNGDVSVTAAGMSNSAQISAGNNLSTTVSGALDNSGGNLAAGQALQINAASVKNTAGIINASTVGLTVPQLDNSHGKITADQLTIHATDLTNETGQIAQFGTGTNIIAVANALDNSNGGVLQTNSADLTLTPQTLNNAGGSIALAGSGTLTVTAGSGVLQNQQGSIGGNGVTNISALSIANQGGSMFGQKATTIAATQGDIDNSAGGYLGGSQLTVNAAGGVNNTAGKIEGTQSGLTVNANSLSNAAGTVQSLGGALLSITAAQGISNGVANGVGGFIGSAGAANINAGPVDNTGGTLYAKDALSLQSNGQLSNSYGVIQSGTDLSAIATGAVDNANGRIEANGSTATMTVSGASVDNTSGRIANSGTGLTQINGGSQITNTNAANTPNMGTIGGNGDLTLTSTNLDNSSNGQVIAAGNLTLNTSNNVNNNAGNLYAGQSLQLNQAGAAVTNVGGRITAGGPVNVSVASFSNIFGLLATNAGGDIALATSGNLDNTAGTIASAHNLTLTVPTLVGNGQVVAQQDAVISLQGDYANTAGNLLTANRDLTLSTTGNLTNTGNLEAVRNLTLNAANVDNQSSGLMNAGNGETVIHSSNAITNTGRIYGNDIALGAQTLTNDVDTTTNQAGVIASRNTLQIGAQQITNREHALIESLSDMAMGGALDANNNVTGSAASILNSSATINSGGALTLQTASLLNQNNHFTTIQQIDPTQTTQVTEYAQWAAPTTWYTPSQVTWSDSGDGGIVLVTPDGNRFEKFYKKDYTQTVAKTVVTSSDPGQISSAGNMTLSGNVTNDKSTIIAGGTLGGMVGSINNIGATGSIDTVDHMTAGENYYHWVSGHPHQNYYTYDNNGAAYDVNLPSTPLALQVWTVQQNTQPVTGPNQAVGNGVGGSALPSVGALQLGANQSGLTTGAANANTVGTASGSAGKVTSTTGSHQTLGTPQAPLPNLVLPNNQLYTIHTQPNQPYLIETDPKFTNYGNFLSSNYMLGLLGVNPASTEKRLGDGFYEAQTVTNQIAQLTGKRFLDGYASNEDEYKALMDSGVATAKQFQLTPGIALTDAQMAALTSDIVWMVSTDVTLPDGTHTQVLAPVVYLTRADASDISPTGALISGKDIDLKVNGTLQNGGTLQASNNMIIQATDIANTGDIRSTGANGATILVAQNDVLNNGGSISGHRVGILAGRDVTMSTDAISATSVQGTNTVLGPVASVTADQLSIQAGRDINLAAVSVNTTGDAALSAGRDVNLTAVNTQNTYNVTYNADNHLYENQTQVNGTSINAGGKLALVAGQDINAAAAYATAGGQLAAVAGRDVNLGTAQQTSSLDQAIYTTSHGMLSSSTSRSQANANTTAAVGSTLSGDSVIVQAGRDIGVTGSNVVGTNDVSLSAANNINITTSQNTVKQSFSSKETSSGMFSSGMTVTMGNKEQDSQNQYQAVTNNGSLVGSTNGNVTINAGNHYTQTGSQVTALAGDVGIAAKAVDINAAYDTTTESSKNHTEQSGLSLGVSAPIITAVQTIQHMSSAAGKTDDPRMKLLAGATAVGAASDAASAAQNPSQGVTVSLTVGSSKSDSASTESSSTVVGSSVKAGGNVSIAATGAGTDSNLNVIGSSISAGQNAVLKADGDINLKAAQSTDTQQSSSSSSSAAVGIAATYGSNGWAFGITASASGSKGNGNGTDLTNVNSDVSAGNTLVLSSGHDTNLIGAVASGNQVLANVGTSGQGNLNIQSLQDTSTYKSKDQSIGGTVTIGYGASGSFSASQSKVNGDYASVGEQSGIKAGDGGFVVNVNGNTDLKGGVIASTATPDKNLLVTQTLTQSNIQNNSSYSASSQSVGGGYGVSSGGNSSTQDPHIMSIQQGGTGTAAGVSSTSGSSSGTSYGGVSAGTVVITNDKAQQQLTGQTAAQAVASVNNNVGVTNTGSISQGWNGQQLNDKVTAGAQITAAFGQQAAAAIGTYADKQQKDLIAQAKQAADNGDPDQAAALQAQAAQWAEGGEYRVALHTGVGALTGGAGGAAGALVSAEAMTTIASAIKGMGLPDAVASGLTQVAATALGAVVGGGAGAAAGLNVEANNRELHQSERDRIHQLAGGNAVEEDRLTAAACVLTNCAAAYPSDSQEGIYYAELQARGATYTSELATLQQQRSINFLDLSTSDMANDFVKQMGRNALQGLKQGALTGYDFFGMVGSGVAGIEPEAPASDLGKSVVQNGAGSTAAAVGMNALNTAAGALNGNSEDVGKILGGVIVGEGLGVLSKVGAATDGITIGENSVLTGTRADIPTATTVSKVDLNSAIDDALQYIQYQKNGGWDWPPNLGFVGQKTEATLPVGTQLDRIGDPSGSFLAPAGSSYESRALAPGSGASVVYQYEVIKPLPVVQGEIAPAFGQQGGGTQILPNVGQRVNVQWLVDNGYIKPIKK
ncbi:hemagglutinin repeat-containing protein [Collimonas sp. NPDC087041]|uniref:hemagglutinin repeat-containing protein n=1 Tax=Collimonas sp. NPDC087041 TaxID=3363960 RepID=UPI00380DC705